MGAFKPLRLRIHLTGKAGFSQKICLFHTQRNHKPLLPPNKSCVTIGKWHPPFCHEYDATAHNHMIYKYIIIQHDIFVDISRLRIFHPIFAGVLGSWLALALWAQQDETRSFREVLVTYSSPVVLGRSCPCF